MKSAAANNAFLSPRVMLVAFLGILLVAPLVLSPWMP